MASLSRWRVVILDDDDESRAMVRAAVWRADGEVAGEVSCCSEVPSVVERTKPDVGVFAFGLPDGNGVDAAAMVARQAGCPVVLLTHHTESEVVTRARVAGVMGYLLKPLRPAELAPALDLAVARFGDAEELRRRLQGRKVIERAKGVLMLRHALTEEEAFGRLRRAAMDSRRTMVEVAREVLAAPAGASETRVNTAY